MQTVKKPCGKGISRSSGSATETCGKLQRGLDAVLALMSGGDSAMLGMDGDCAPHASGEKLPCRAKQCDGFVCA